MGTFTKPHGIRGELTVYCPAEDPKLLKGEVLIAPPSFKEQESSKGELLPAEIISLRMHKGSPLVFLKDLKDRTQAESFRQHKIYIRRSKLPPTDEDEYYITDLLGCRVYLHGSDGEESFLGCLVATAVPAGQELWTIETEDGQEILLPAVPEFVKDIKLDEEIIIITPPQGLIELNLKE